jgi:hypothetical protein
MKNRVNQTLLYMATMCIVATPLPCLSATITKAKPKPKTKAHAYVAPHPTAPRMGLAPAGLLMPITLSTGISTSVAQQGDPIQATVSQYMNLGAAAIPAGSVVSGFVTNAEASSRMGHSGHLGIKFVRLNTPDGAVYPITAHLVGGLDKYHDNPEAGPDQFRGDNGGTKLKAAAVRGAAGAGAGALLGTAVGGISGGGWGAGRGAWSGTVIGAGLGVADSLLLRKGREINLPRGTAMKLQLDAPVPIAISPVSRNY